MEFSPGYRFMPTDEELIVCYLKPKIDDLPIPSCEINVVDISTYNPETLAAEYPSRLGQKEWYFFTPRDRKYQNGLRPNRSAGDGFWKATGANKPIRSEETKEIIGYKRVLVFHHGDHQNSQKTNWIMYEYTVAAPETRPPRRRKQFPNPNYMRLDEWVICRIHERETKSNKAELDVNNNNNNVPIRQNHVAAIQDPYHALQPQQMDQQQQQYALDLAVRNDDCAIPDDLYQCALRIQKWDMDWVQQATVRTDDFTIEDDLSHQNALQPQQWDQQQLQPEDFQQASDTEEQEYLTNLLNNFGS